MDPPCQPVLGLVRQEASGRVYNIIRQRETREDEHVLPPWPGLVDIVRNQHNGT